jgi:aminopeptidase N
MVIARLKTRLETDSSLGAVPFVDYGKKDMTRSSYSVGRLMFATLYDLVAQAEFNRIVGGYYQRFANGGATVDFIDFSKRSASRDLTRFFDEWMLTSGWSKTITGAKSVKEIADHYRRN